MKFCLNLINNGVHLLSKLFRELAKFGIRERIAWVLSPTKMHLYHYERDKTLRGAYWFLIAIPLESICEVGSSEVSSGHGNIVQFFMTKEDFINLSEKMLKIDSFSQTFLDLHFAESQSFLRFNCTSDEYHFEFVNLSPIEIAEVEVLPEINPLIKVVPFSSMLRNFTENIAQEKSELTIMFMLNKDGIDVEVRDELDRRKLIFTAKSVYQSSSLRISEIQKTFEAKLDKSLVKRFAMLFDFGITTTIGLTQEGYFFVELSPLGEEPSLSSQAFTFGFLNPLSFTT